MLSEIHKISVLVKSNGGKAFLVGGCVRDMYLNLVPKDFDIEVFGVQPELLIEILGAQYQVDLVGKSFGVIKLKNLPIDVSLPRKEICYGTGHKDFQVSCDPFMTIEDAAQRRDFTINSLMFDPLSNIYIDPTGRGILDLHDEILDPVSEKFMEDPLRVLRAMQFIARFGFRPSQKLIDYSLLLSMSNLSKERIFDEFNKFLLKGKYMRLGLDFLVNSSWISFFPELGAILNTPQDPTHHPEGEVYSHIGFVLDAFAQHRTGDDNEDLVMGYAALCHDFGKATHTTWCNEKHTWISHGHEEAGEAPTRSFMARLTNQEEFINEIVGLVKNHLRPRLLFKANAGKSAIRRLALEVRIDRLCHLNKLDQMGRTPLNPIEFPEVDWLLGLASTLNIQKSGPQPIIMGRHLISLGIKPGVEMGVLLKKCFEAQLNGVFETVEDGISWFNANLK